MNVQSPLTPPQCLFVNFCQLLCNSLFVKSSILSWESVHNPVLNIVYSFFAYKLMLSFSKEDPSVFFTILFYVFEF